MRPEKIFILVRCLTKLKMLSDDIGYDWLKLSDSFDLSMSERLFTSATDDNWVEYEIVIFDLSRTYRRACSQGQTSIIYIRSIMQWVSSMINSWQWRNLSVFICYPERLRQSLITFNDYFDIIQKKKRFDFLS